PLVSIGAPIPGLAYAPLFLLWFGLGNLSAVLLVGFVSAFPIVFNTWTGVKAVKEIWLRYAQVMGADDRRLLRHVILPGALPYMLTGLRLGLAQAWRILVGIEMLAAVPWGLGWMIFGAREFLNTDVMLAGVVVIAVIGVALEKLVFQRLEGFTVVRWGVMSWPASPQPTPTAAGRPIGPGCRPPSRRPATRRSRAAAPFRRHCCRRCRRSRARCGSSPSTGPCRSTRSRRCTACSRGSRSQSRSGCRSAS